MRQHFHEYNKLCVCRFSPAFVPKFSTQPAVNKSIGTDDLDIIFGVGWRFLVDIFSKNKKVFPALQATFSFRLQFHSLLGSVGGLSWDKLLLSRPSLQSFLWNLLKSSRHVTSRNQGLSPRRQGRKRREGLGTRLWFRHKSLWRRRQSSRRNLNLVPRPPLLFLPRRRGERPWLRLVTCLCI